MFVAANVLVVDAGNTSVKFTAFEGEAVIWFGRELSALVSSGFVPEVIYFASVRSQPDDELLISQVLDVYSSVKCVELKTEEQACGVVNAYPESHRLGVDRWLSLIAAYHHVKANVAVVDVGTAIKIDLVDMDGKHLGGYIAPGLSLMETSLLSNTAKIQYAQDEVVAGNGLPNSTARAVNEGCHEMSFGFLERIYKKYPDFNWLITGGDAAFFLDALEVPMQYYSNLVADGARLVGDELLRGNQ